MVTGMATWDTFDQRLTEKRRGIVEGLLEFVRQNTVSQNPQGVRTGGEWLAALMRRRRLEVRVLETGGGPAVFGERRAPGATRTVLIYCHYDTKPAPAKEWFQPSPFEPVFRKVGDADDAPFASFDRVPTETLTGWRVYARGASDDKGPIWSHLEALALLDELRLPPRVNLKFIFDGEEEIGSPFFGPLVEKHKDLLAADLVLVTDGPKHASGRPTIAFGARGVLKLELTLESARRDLHSGNFAAPNPNWRLAGLLSSMAAPDGAPLIEGFEEDVAAPTQAERELMGRLPLDLRGLERELGVPLPEDYLDKIMFHPTLTIRGLQSGFVGAEANTIIPHKSTVAFDIRIVKNQKIETVYRRVLDHIRAQGFEVIEGADAPLPDHLRGRAVRVSDKGGYDPAKTPADLPICAEVVAAVERAHGGQQAVVMPTMGGSVPIWAFTDILRLPTILVPYANANNRQHSPNEHLRLDHLFQGVRTTAGLLRDLGG
jgi:acetylornithine deacetylase/succinyl-diaminopimelate desuccinylase-like protein